MIFLLKEKKKSIFELLSEEGLNKDSILFSLEQILFKLESRQNLLEQAIKFHKTSKDVSLRFSFNYSLVNFLHFCKFAEKICFAIALFDDANENEFNTTELGYAIIERHHDAKKDILQSSLTTFDEGKELIERMKEMSSQIIDVDNKYETTVACHSIEHLLEKLNNRRRYLEDLWQQRKIKLDQCLQICYLKEEIQKVFNRRTL